MTEEPIPWAVLEARALERSTARARAQQRRAEQERARAERERERVLAQQERERAQERERERARERMLSRATTPAVITDPALRVPAECPRGHELTARTTHIRHVAPASWECVRCLRADCYRIHFHLRHTAPVPAEILDESGFIRQPPTGSGKAQPGEPWPDDGQSWWTRVFFASGWGFLDPDPTPEFRAAREAYTGERTPESRHTAYETRGSAATASGVLSCA